MLYYVSWGTNICAKCFTMVWSNRSDNMIKISHEMFLGWWVDYPFWNFSPPPPFWDFSAPSLSNYPPGFSKLWRHCWSLNTSVNFLINNLLSTKMHPYTCKIQSGNNNKQVPTKICHFMYVYVNMWTWSKLINWD